MTFTVQRPEPGNDAGATTRASARPYLSITAATALASALTAGILAFWVGWTRRWISDDGLIVLRTVRNLLAGNGPVFNAGERVEANTSTLWQYLIYLVALITDARLEDIAMWLALIFTTLASVIAVLATAHLHRHRTALLLPVGVVVYFSLSPARDFATSGLEWGLVLLWISVQWALLVWWATGRRQAHAVREVAGAATYVLAFWSGLSWLIRPELALYGGLTGILLLVTATSWRSAVGILAVALPIPAAYQIFRMGYYGLIVPHTAVAKSASDSLWGTGWGYVLDFTGPYYMWIVLAVLVGLAVITGIAIAKPGPWSRPSRLELRNPAVVTALIVVCALIHILYVIRVGGDFMHGRMLLPPLFALLLPLSVVPIHLVQISWREITAGVLILTTWIWSTVVLVNGHDWTSEGQDIVDERVFWIGFTNRDEDEPPMYAEDFLTQDSLHDYVEVMRDQTLIQPTGQQLSILTPDGSGYSWITTPRVPFGDLNEISPTIFHVNLGMTSMNAPLNVRVTDLIGLATPLAARQPRIEDGRIGHDKLMSLEWQTAESATPLEFTPPWIDAEMTAQARQALRHPDLVRMFQVYREPMSYHRFVDNIKFSLTLGRTLEIPKDPEEILSEFDAAPPEWLDGLPVIAWPVDIQLDEPR